MWTVYALIDPITGKVRYIGITCKPLDSRLAGHLRDDPKENNHKALWIRKLKRQGVIPKIATLKNGLTKDEACLMEQQYIKQYKDAGTDLVNLSNGGEAVMAGRKHSGETIQKMKAAHKGEKNAFFGKHHSPESIAKMRKARSGKKSWNKGKRLSNEHRENLSKSHKGIAVWNKGKSRVNFDEILRLLDNGHTQTELSEMFGIDQGYISRKNKQRKRQIK